MLNSLLGIGIDSLLMDIFIILGVVIAGALIIYFVWELVASIANKNKKPEKELVFDNKNEKRKELGDTFVLERDEKTQAPVVLVETNKLTEVNEEVAQEEKAEIETASVDEEKANADRRAMLEARRQELMRRMQAQLDEDEKVEEKKEETIEEEKVEEVEEPVAQTVEEVSRPMAFEVEEETVEEADNSLEEERKALEEEKTRYATMVKELERAKVALAEQTREMARAQAEAEAAVNAPVVQPIPVEYSLDELKEKLALAEERLRTTEKEFKQCKKEYIPLRKVWVAHEKDEKKLRRKEALVAKQKVLLYGVNNYADIDEEKAKKLAEDLDLLDGLKLSVQHCEEVMKKNEERYPLLEKMYNVLKLRNDELKKDIATYKAEIEKLEAEQDAE
ncbi:MAG: hypothetical protein E7375_03300 [Clostridiales bacterium]|nr:hypothetical protein [Clostridiales bacterium]